MSSTSARVALVTGASRGIGEAVARALASAGWRVICVARSQKALEKLDDAISSEGKGESTLVPLDLKDYDGIDRLAPVLLERFGKLDALAACAGALGALTPSFQAAPRVIEETIGVNYVANQRILRAVHPLLRASDAGRAVFVTSGVAQEPMAYWAPYSASKAALEALVTCYAAENEITSIRTNLFSPGPTRTAMRAKAFPGEDPMTLPTPDEVAAQLTPLLSPSETRNGALIRFERA